VLLALPSADHLLIERDPGQFVPSRRMMAKQSAFGQNPAPRAAYPGTAAQRRVVSMSGIRLGVGESARAFKGIICDDISEFESFMPSHAVSLWAMFRVTRSRRDPHAA
jgi:hypothetical protein